MSHIHLPDGILPTWLWCSGFILAIFTWVIFFRLIKREDLGKRLPLLGMMAAAMVPRRPRASDRMAVGMRAMQRRGSRTAAPRLSRTTNETPRGKPRGIYRNQPNTLCAIEHCVVEAWSA